MAHTRNAFIRRLALFRTALDDGIRVIFSPFSYESAVTGKKRKVILNSVAVRTQVSYKKAILHVHRVVYNWVSMLLAREARR